MDHELRRLLLALEQETSKVMLALPQRVAMETMMEGGYTTIDGSGLQSVVKSIREHYTGPSFEDIKYDHIEGVSDEGTAYTQRKGWTLTCLYCGNESVGETKKKALGLMKNHYAPFGIEVIP